MRRLCPNRETRGTGVNLGQSVFVLSQCSSSNTSNRAPIAYTSAFMGVAMILKSPSFCSRSQAENAHILRVLPLGDEFRERIGFCGSEEKFGKCLAQRVCHDKFRWRDARTNGSQPGPE